MYRVFRTLFLCLGSAGLLAACGGEEPAPQQQQAEPAAGAYLVAVNHPLEYFARRLIGDEVEVRLPAPADIDPALWQPSVGELLELQGASLVLLNGAGYSPWLDKVSLAESRLLVTSESAREQWLERQGEVTHSHGPAGAHAHSGYLFTTWMDLQLARVQAEAIAAALIRLWPDQRNPVAARLQALLADIDALDAAYEAELLRLAGRQIIYSHPVYQYFERRYGVPGLSLHWEPDVMPSPAQWRELEELAGDRALFVWEAQPDAAIAGKMREMGIEFVVIDPAGNEREQDWLAVQRENIERLRAVR